MSLAKRIIPCLDVHAGRVVKGVNFVSLSDAGDPVAIAERYNEAGADELLFLDISASAEERQLLLDIVESVASKVFIPLTVGGGIRTLEDVRRVLNAGADKVSFNSSAISNPDIITEASDRYGAQCIVVAIDAKFTSNGQAENLQQSKDYWQIFTHGGRRATGIDALVWARRMAEAGAGELLVTSMDRDGTKSGFDIPLTRAIADSVRIPVIASGGVGNLSHLAEGILSGKADAVLAASIFHFGEYTIAEAKDYLASFGITVRRD